MRVFGTGEPGALHHPDQRPKNGAPLKAITALESLAVCLCHLQPLYCNMPMNNMAFDDWLDEARRLWMVLYPNLTFDPVDLVAASEAHADGLSSTDFVRQVSDVHTKSQLLSSTTQAPRSKNWRDDRGSASDTPIWIWTLTGINMLIGAIMAYRFSEGDLEGMRGFSNLRW